MNDFDVESSIIQDEYLDAVSTVGGKPDEEPHLKEGSVYFGGASTEARSPGRIWSLKEKKIRKEGKLRKAKQEVLLREVHDFFDNLNGTGEIHGDGFIHQPYLTRNVDSKDIKFFMKSGMLGGDMINTTLYGHLELMPSVQPWRLPAYASAVAREAEIVREKMQIGKAVGAVGGGFWAYIIVKTVEKLAHTNLNPFVEGFGTLSGAGFGLQYSERIASSLLGMSREYDRVKGNIDGCLSRTMNHSIYAEERVVGGLDVLKEIIPSGLKRNLERRELL